MLARRVGRLALSTQSSRAILLTGTTSFIALGGASVAAECSSHGSFLSNDPESEFHLIPTLQAAMRAQCDWSEQLV